VPLPHALWWCILLLLCLCFTAGDAQAQLRTGRDASSGFPAVPDTSDSPEISTTALDDDDAERLEFSDRRVELSLDLPQGSGPWIVDEAEFSCDLSDCEDED